MSAALDTHSPTLRLARPEPSLRDPEGLDAVELTMLRLVGTGDRAARMARQHLGSGGKRLRARLALAASSALGASLRDAIVWAAAVELLHNATLVHDDIQDGDTMRRGAPTLWAAHGTAQAINAGDFLLMLPYLALDEGPPQLVPELCRGLSEHAVRTVRGQMAELALLAEGALDWARYTAAITGKTGALIGLPVFGAAILAGRSRPQAELLSDAFANLGVMFQLQDDVVDLFGDKGRERSGCDLYEGKVSALVVAHLERRPEERERLVALLRAPRHEAREAEVARFIAAFAEQGALADVLQRIDDLARAIRECRALSEEPSLRRVALDLTALALAPILHLFRKGDAA